jgi:hypothetical protein
MKCKAFIVITLLILISCSHEEVPISGDQRDFNPKALNDHPMLQTFIANHPGKEVLKYAEADINNDSRKDLVVIYRLNRDENRMCLMVSGDGDDSFIESNSVPAPISDQNIRFKDIDNKPPLEFIVQGRKGAMVGYAIFRFEDGVLVDLFGEGFENCC